MNNPTCIYLSPYDILRPRTNQVSDVRFCEGFSQNGCKSHLIVPYVKRFDNINKKDIEKVYGLESPVEIHYLPTNFKKDITGKLKSYYIAILTAFKVINILKKESGKNGINIISRSAPLIKAVLIIRRIRPNIFKNTKLIFWAHDFKKKPSFLNVYNECDVLFATNSSIADELVKYTNKKSNNIFVTLNPITEAQANFKLSKKEARNILNLNDIDVPLLVYTGKIAKDYNLELEYILKAVKLNSNIKFLCTGGKPEAITYWKNWCLENKIENAIFTGYIPDYSIIKYYQFAADILISYYTKQGHDVNYNLPNKLCEYMLSGNIIITPDYKATQDILNSNNCCFADPENEVSLSDVIQKIIANKEDMQFKANIAKENVKEFTFKKRSRLILEFLKN